MTGFLIVFGCSFYVVFELRVGVESLIFFGLLRRYREEEVWGKREKKDSFFLLFFLFYLLTS